MTYFTKPLVILKMVPVNTVCCTCWSPWVMLCVCIDTTNSKALTS